MSADSKIWRTEIHVDRQVAQSILDAEDWSEYFDPPPVIAVSDVESEVQCVEILMGGRVDERTRVRLADLLRRHGAMPNELVFEPVENRDWVSESQKHLRPVKAGRFVVHGAHDADKIEPGETPILIEAGQAFGTGHHASTQGCLLAIDWLGGRVTPTANADIGTGSGVLAMAMAKTWLAPVLASDVDPIAVRIGQANAQANGIDNRPLGAKEPGIAFIQAEGLEDPGFDFEGPFDVITANILAGPLIQMARSLSAALKPGGYLILSGFLDSEELEVFEAYRAWAFRLAKQLPIDNWRTLILQKVIE